MKKLIVCLLSIVFCYGFTYSSKEEKALTKFNVIANEASVADLAATAISNTEESLFHPLLFLTSLIK